MVIDRPLETIGRLGARRDDDVKRLRRWNGHVGNMAVMAVHGHSSLQARRSGRTRQPAESLSRAKTHRVSAAIRPALRRAVALSPASEGSLTGLEDRRYSLAARTQDFVRALILGRSNTVV